MRRQILCEIEDCYFTGDEFCAIQEIIVSQVVNSVTSGVWKWRR